MHTEMPIYRQQFFGPYGQGAESPIYRWNRNLLLVLHKCNIWIYFLLLYLLK